MRTTTAAIFFAIFITITGLISFYIFIRGLQSIPDDSSLRHAYIVIFWTVALSFIGGRILETILPSIVSDCLVWIGSFWIAAMLYLLIAVVLLDVLRLGNYFFSFFPPAVTRNYVQAKYATAAGVILLIGTILLVGHINSLMPRIRKLNLPVAKKTAKMKSLKIVAATDIHLGTIVGRSRIDQIVDKINGLDPDVVLLPGDIVDEDLSPVIKQNLGEALENVKARFGIYAATGNHEYIGGVERACSYLTKHGIVMLRDQSVKVNDSFFLVGREDLSIARFNGHQRKALPELMAAVDRNYPVILMDHQPFGLNEAALQGIDLQISGHTHDGQLWPVSYIVHRIYELAWGYKKISNTHYYVSDGVGTWGPPVRVGNRPEIVQILLNFE